MLPQQSVAWSNSSDKVYIYIYNIYNIYTIYNIYII